VKDSYLGQLIRLVVAFQDFTGQDAPKQDRQHVTQTKVKLQKPSVETIHYKQSPTSIRRLISVSTDTCIAQH